MSCNTAFELPGHAVIAGNQVCKCTDPCAQAKPLLLSIAYFMAQHDPLVGVLSTIS